MGKSRIFILLSLFVCLAMLSGCSFDILETDNPPTLPKLDLASSTLTGVVEYVNGRTCRVVITEGDSHYDAATEDDEADVIQLTFTTLEGSKSLLVGDTVTFTYSYTDDVSEYNGNPHITVNKVKVG